MLDAKFIRENKDLVRQAAQNKGRDARVVDQWIELDAEFRELLHAVEGLRAKRNSVSKQIANNPENKHKYITQATALKTDLKEKQQKLKEIEEKLYQTSLLIPNIPHPDVPLGPDAGSNKVIKTWGEKPDFPFEAKDHIAIARRLDLIDLERGAKIGGFRSYFLKNEAAQMELALMHYTFQKLAGKGYCPLIAPSLVKEFTLVGNGQFPWGREEVYSIPKDEIYLAGTAEVPVTAYFSNETINETDLPKKFVAFSPCFRREAGSYGKDTKGLYRLHQFNKIEQVIIARNDQEESLKLHQELLANSEQILQDLKLHYRVLLMCTGDMGEPQVKKYDIETWMPGRPNGESETLGAYGETMSNSFMGEFQARRLNIRYLDKNAALRFAHTLNNTAIASPRILIAILENYQQEDGSVIVPEVLRSYVGKDIIRSRPNLR